ESVVARQPITLCALCLSLTRSLIRNLSPIFPPQYSRTKSVTVNNRNWHTNPASAAQVANGTFIILPVPPQSSREDPGLGAAAETTGNAAFSHTVLAAGPNNGYAYYPSIPTWSPLFFKYTINPDLENSGSTFSQKQ